jgi:Zn-dependent protease
MFDDGAAFVQWTTGRFALWVVLALSLTVHEWAHAAEARRLGDRTAEGEGRLSLNPLDHLDPLGTVIMPFLGIPFGWARPVPIEPLRFSAGVSMRWGLLRAAAAGPLSNLVVAALAGLVWVVAAEIAPGSPLWQLSRTFVQVNLGLALFNLLPVPPLDGSRVVAGLLPEPWASAYARLGTIGSVIGVFLIALLLLTFGELLLPGS